VAIATVRYDSLNPLRVHVWREDEGVWAVSHPDLPWPMDHFPSHEEAIHFAQRWARSVHLGELM